jgi:hypothetical protein
VTRFEAAARAVVVDCAAAVTVTETADEVLVREAAEPVYKAVKLYVPAARDAVDSVATPEGFRAAVPRTVLPFRKVTAPVGMAAPFACTVAVRVNAWPTAIALGEAERLVVVG